MPVKYSLFNHVSQVLAGGSASSKSSAPPSSLVCSDCGAEATKECYDCIAIFCQKCCDSFHSGMRNALHTPVPYSAANGAVRPSVRCSEHGKPWEFFCVECKQLVCVNCCIAGCVKQNVIAYSTLIQQ